MSPQDAAMQLHLLAAVAVLLMTYGVFIGVFRLDNLDRRRADRDRRKAALIAFAASLVTKKTGIRA